jgi:hypothetical protein
MGGIAARGCGVAFDALPFNRVAALGDGLQDSLPESLAGKPGEMLSRYMHTRTLRLRQPGATSVPPSS